MVSWLRGCTQGLIEPPPLRWTMGMEMWLLPWRPNLLFTPPPLRWTMGMEMWLLPWRPNLLFTGRTFYKVVTRKGGGEF